MLWLILAVAFWGFFHSFNASHRVKEFYRRTFGEVFMRFYRLMYNTIAAITFFPVIVLLLVLPSEVLYRVPIPWSYAMIAGQLFFASCLFAAFLQFGLLFFIGLRQLVEEPGKRELVTGGLYSYVRHPFYTFFLLFLWLTPILTVNLLVVYFALTVYIHIGIFFEERNLLRDFGEQYAEYRAITPMLFPVPKFARNNWFARLVVEMRTSDKT
jgi:protein-S-isoprenylcysteine O-methyltransferase Ste14